MIDAFENGLSSGLVSWGMNYASRELGQDVAPILMFLAFMFYPDNQELVIGMSPFTLHSLEE